MENVKRLFIIGILIFIIILSVILLIGYGTKKKFYAQPVRYSINEAPFLPLEPGLQDAYIYANDTASFWTKEACEVWFTAPDGKLLEQLENSNDMMVKRILESAP